MPPTGKRALSTAVVQTPAKGESTSAGAQTPSKGEKEASWDFAVEFGACFVGLQVSYLVWGVMQELIMNSTFVPTPMNPTGKFPSATFCVFSNRFLAIIVAAAVCRIKHGTVISNAPLWYFAPCALSNTVSSWSQYQALSFVSFSLQTLFKATKVIPVMVMGRLLKGTRYSAVEYVEALLITAGVGIFSFSSKGGGKGGSISSSSDDHSVTGFALLCVYVLSDSFTSQWQVHIRTHHTPPYIVPIQPLYSP